MHCLRCGAELADDQLACTQCGFLEEITGVQQAKVKTKPVREIVEHSYGGFWRRCAAIVLDFLILTGGEAVLAAVIGGIIMLMALVTKHHVDLHIIGSFATSFGIMVSFAANWIYFTWFESSKFQATLGKKIMGLIVVDTDGKAISLGQANIRYWSKFISSVILFGGFWMMAFIKKKRTLHDLIAGTTVIRQEKSGYKQNKKTEPES